MLVYYFSLNEYTDKHKNPTNQQQQINKQTKQHHPHRHQRRRHAKHRYVHNVSYLGQNECSNNVI